MDIGVHLPLIDFDGRPRTLQLLRDYATAAEELGFAALTVNDHFVYPKPWLDGPTALAAVMHSAPTIGLMTTIALPVVRGPIALAKTLLAIDVLSGGRLTVGVGPGSSALDFTAVGVPFSERWPRFEEAVAALRSLMANDQPAFSGRFYETGEIALAPRSPQMHGPQIWIGSWGSGAGLRRVARLADGWLASAYNTTPTGFADAKQKLVGYLRKNGKSPDSFPNAIATMWTYISEDRTTADRILREHVVSMINRPEADLRDQLCIGSAESCAMKLTAYRQAGVDRVLIWPVTDELGQIEQFKKRVEPLIA